MIELTADEIVNQIVQEAQLDTRLLLLVEGDEECQFLDMHLDLKACRTMPGGGKDATLGAAAQIAEMELPWVRVIVDADFMHVGQPNPPLPWPSNVVTTERYDLLADLIECEPAVLRRVALSHSAPGSLLAWEDGDLEKMATSIAAATTVVGALRLLVVRGVFDFSVRGFSMHNAAIAEGDAVVTAVCQEAAVRAGGRLPFESIRVELERQISELTSKQPDLVQNSHDTVAALSVLIRRRGDRHVRVTSLEASIRSAVSCINFIKTVLAETLNVWAQELRGRPLWTCP